MAERNPILITPNWDTKLQSKGADCWQQHNMQYADFLPIPSYPFIGGSKKLVHYEAGEQDESDHSTSVADIETLDKCFSYNQIYV